MRFNFSVTVIGVYDYVADEWHTLGEYTLKEFKKLADSRDVCVGFNNLGFDNNLLKACDIVLDDRRCYDIPAEIYRTLGGRRKGCRLADVCRVNFNADKSGDGAGAPVHLKGFHYRVSPQLPHFGADVFLINI